MLKIRLFEVKLFPYFASDGHAIEFKSPSLSLSNPGFATMPEFCFVGV